MLRKSIVLALICIFVGSLAGCATKGTYDNRGVTTAAPGLKFVDKDTLRSWLDDPMLIIIDVRKSSDWPRSSSKIKGAVHRDPEKEKVAVWGQTLPKDRKFVLYCA